MPVDFLTDHQEKSYGQYAGPPSPAQLDRYFYLNDADREAIDRRRGEHNRLGFALQLCTVKYLGTFLANPVDVPPEVLATIAAQLGISDSTCLDRYRHSETRWDHTTEIRQQYGYGPIRT